MANLHRENCNKIRTKNHLTIAKAAVRTYPAEPNSRSFGAQDFWLLDLATKQSRRLTQLTDPDPMRTFDVTPDGKQIIFDRLPQNSDIVLIDLPPRPQ